MQSRAWKTRFALTTAAARAFGAHGYESTSVQEILRAAGLTKGAFYFHFSSKEELASCIVGMEGATWSTLAMRVRAAERSGIRGLIDFSFEASRRLMQDPVARAGTRLRLEGRGFGQPTGRAETQWFFIVMEFLALAQEHGELRPGLDLRATAEVFVETFAGVQLLSDAGSGWLDLERRLTTMWRITLPILVEPEVCAAFTAGLSARHAPRDGTDDRQ
ncbi:ScbR family autoregulator-binding transcription factor [Kitasatospora sp. NPDC052896]|uniref:ScbR family autoregulator-binding transcription factor n=1 Tax=Kitasatospora sp. NPDC052896 TaxID=3364061 RepID=UPI0037C959A8